MDSRKTAGEAVKTIRLCPNVRKLPVSLDWSFADFLEKRTPRKFPIAEMVFLAI
jgi:hypothetical protein